MMRMIRLCAATLGMIVLASTGAAIADTAPASAACKERLLTFPAWYKGLVDNDCNVKQPSGENGLITFITRLALNIVEIILQIVAYASLIFIIKGGFDYMLSAGDSNKMSSAKNTIQNAIIGLVIALMSVGIVNLVAETV